MDIPPWMLAPLRDELENDNDVLALEETRQSHGHSDQSIRLITGLVVRIVYDSRPRSP
jgi:hypothetical protein